MTEPATAALILGAAVWEGGPSPTLRRRAMHGAALWHAGEVAHLVPCGGLGRHPPSEGEAMRDLLIEAGVPGHAIHPETASRDTLDNIRLALPILARIGARRVVVVSDAAHLPRALLVARHFGLDARGHAPPHGARLVPQLRLALREIPAYGAYLWRLRRY
ncbi:YdcF family protein [Limimaricola litoreus]|uniref:YdcF family protein n=1 Tax=Limimaricola litoreus TaxID=2955316 RepID=A0A9X2JN59_9RHOB|nr:YdcF family protein [Limimaricola litoreus]MCP1167189.1 YdcF family protein [Limimaricola litoreus]